MAGQANIVVSARRILDGEIVEGEPEELGNIGIHHAGRERGSLYVLVEAKGTQHEDMEAMLVDSIITFYQRASTSVTSALIGAIKEANALLNEENRTSMRGQQTQAGVYCALVRPNQDLLLAYAGPMAAIMIGDDTLDRLPSGVQPGVVHPTGLPAAAGTPLGVQEDIEPYLFLSEFGPGDMLVLASPTLLESSDEELINALTEAGVEGLPGDRDGTALVLTYTTTKEPIRAPSGTSAVSAQGVSAATGSRQPTAGHPSVIQSLGSSLKSTLQRATPSTRTPTTPSAKPSFETDTLPSWLDQGQRAGRRRAPQLKRPSLHLPALGRPTGWLVFVAAILIIVAAAFLWQKQAQTQARERDFKTLISKVETQRALGQASLDRSQAVAYFREAESLVNQALAIKPEEQTALALRDSIRRDMDEAKGIVRLAPSQVTSLYSFTAPGTSPGRVIGDGTNLYVLDKGDQKVYRLVLNQQGNTVQPGSDTVVIRKGAQVGGTVVSDLVDIAYVPAGGTRRTNTLMILDSSGNLFEYDPARGLGVLPIKDAGTWRKVQATGGYGGNFYILDNLANAILRYRPQGRGYEGAPSNYLQSKVELVNAVDMAIDGDIFVLLVNGQVIWLSSGKPQAFPLEGLDRPLAAPVAIFTNTGTEALYVADPANARVVQLSKQGVAKKQLVYEEADGGFQRLRGVFVDEKKNSLYVTAGTKLLHVVLPK